MTPTACDMAVCCPITEISVLGVEKKIDFFIFFSSEAMERYAGAKSDSEKKSISKWILQNVSDIIKNTIKQGRVKEFARRIEVGIVVVEEQLYVLCLLLSDTFDYVLPVFFFLSHTSPLCRWSHLFRLRT